MTNCSVEQVWEANPYPQSGLTAGTAELEIVILHFSFLLSQIHINFAESEVA